MQDTTQEEQPKDTKSVPLYLTQGQFLGTFAKYAVSQSPYHRPDDLERVLDELYDKTGIIFSAAPMGVAKFKSTEELRDVYEQSLAGFKWYELWNDRKNGNDAPFQFTSRYEDGSTNPDDDFIDLDALIGNVVRELERENADIQGIDLVATDTEANKSSSNPQEAV